MVTCGFCGHSGVHATITKEVGGVKYCTGCPRCQEILKKAEEARPNAENRSGDRLLPGEVSDSD